MSVIHREFAHRLLVVKDLNVLIGNLPEEFLYNRGSTMAANAPITIKEALTVRLACVIYPYVDENRLVA